MLAGVMVMLLPSGPKMRLPLVAVGVSFWGVMVRVKLRTAVSVEPSETE
jgi:hypothetical protein